MGNVLGKAAATDLILQWGLFLLAAYLQTEKFYDLAGSSTFILLVIQSIMSSGKYFPRQVIQSSLVCTWAIRLGLFLFWRMMQNGHDSRFNRVRDNPKRFFIYWTIQALWVWLTLLPTLILNSKHDNKELTKRDYVGWGIWLTGMLIESTADFQKYHFKFDPANNGKWISHGLWSIIRHPNYLGEIMMWFGLFISASSTFKGIELVSAISPVFVTLLLTQLSGIPFLERNNMKRWKNNPQFLEYIKKTWRLIPFLY